MRTMLVALAVMAALAGGSQAAPSTALPEAPAQSARTSLFVDLSALGYDLGRFRPDYSGRYPYR
ncbi:MAG TPA: hypothetical protein VFK86_16130 [Bauldia sp.]|nr:hypothetical protein [Bauldia sp.]